MTPIEDALREHLHARARQIDPREVMDPALDHAQTGYELRHARPATRGRLGPRRLMAAASLAVILAAGVVVSQMPGGDGKGSSPSVASGRDLAEEEPGGGEAGEDRTDLGATRVVGSLALDEVPRVESDDRFVPVDEDPGALRGPVEGLLAESRRFFPGVHRGMSCEDLESAVREGSVNPGWAFTADPDSARPPLVPVTFDVEGSCMVVGWLKEEAVFGTLAPGHSLEEYAVYDDDGDVLTHLPVPDDLPPELDPRS